AAAAAAWARACSMASPTSVSPSMLPRRNRPSGRRQPPLTLRPDWLRLVKNRGVGCAPKSPTGGQARRMPDIPELLLPEGRPALLDGGMGRELRNRGVPILDTIWSANALLVAKDVVLQVHKDYIAAGADIITTNTYGVIRSDLAKEGV